MPKYEVLRQHDGDKQYWQGDIREIEHADARQLVELGVLQKARAEPAAGGAKVEPVPQNKMMPAPLNKTSTTKV